MWRPLFVVAFVHWLAMISAADELTTNACESMEIYHIEDFDKLRNCSIVVGHVRLVYLDVNSSVEAAQLTSNVLEITDYLLVYRVNGLQTLETIFPRLRIIRGESLLFDKYAMVINENRNLRELGLVSMLRISAGVARIDNNPMLCFVQTINWAWLFGDNSQHHYTFKNNKSPNHCPVCDGANADYAYLQSSTKNCWGIDAPQLMPAANNNTCPGKCGSSGCDASGYCCQPNCVSGCYAQGCQICSSYKHRFSNKCVDQCVASFLLNKRECVSAGDCRRLGLIPQGNVCADMCPVNYRAMPDIRGSLHCELDCTGHFEIKHASDLALLYDCVTIKGSVTIELSDIREKVVVELERVFATVKEITGYLKVVRSPQLMSLGFLKNLDTIFGDELIDNKYALFVVDNHHLEQIWNSNHQIAIQKGTIFFHLNPRLCYDKIIALASTLKSVQKISIADASPNSNGERVICGPSVRMLEAKVEDFNATAARISVDIMNAEELEILIGYSYHYKEAPVRNVTMYDGRHGCGHDDWLMDISASQNRRHILANLRPFTQYAFFVKTITRTDYHMQVDAYSMINYFTTLPGKPSPVSKLYTDSVSTTKMMLHWWPPLRPNGVIKKYIINYEPSLTADPQANTSTTYKSQNSTLMSDCQCTLRLPYYSGPLPDDENYYDKDQLTYDEALPNIIYVSRRHSEDDDRRDKFAKVQHYSDLHTTTRPTVNPTAKVKKTNEEPDKSAFILGTNTTFAEFEAQAERNYKLYREQLEHKAMIAQDTGMSDFPIIKPLPKCPNENVDETYAKQNNCALTEQLNGTEVPGNQHYLLLDNLNPEIIYNITIRACVERSLEIICSKPYHITAKTVSKSIEKLISSLPAPINVDTQSLHTKWTI